MIDTSPDLDGIRKQPKLDRVDMHCHCLPGLDDGPNDMDQSRSLCRRLVADGVTTVIATPHQLGRYGRTNSGSRIRESVIALQAALDEEHIPLQVLPGAEVRIDDQLVSGLRSRDFLTLGDLGTHLLLELPKQTLIDPSPLCRQLEAENIRVIIAHPERLKYVMKKPDLVQPWLKAGAILQVTAGSLLGEFGPEAERAAWHLVNKGWVQLIASDSHGAARRKPALTDAIEVLRARLGEEAAHRMCITNPARIARGGDLDQGHSRRRSYSAEQTASPSKLLDTWATEVERHGRSLAGKSRSPLDILRRWWT